MRTVILNNSDSMEEEGLLEEDNPDDGLLPVAATKPAASSSSGKLFHCYKSVGEVDRILRTSKTAMSTVIVAGRLGIAARDLGQECFIPLAIGALRHSKMDCHFFFMQLKARSPGSLSYPPLDRAQISIEAIMLPRIQFEKDPFVRYTFTVIDRSHRTLNTNGELRF